MKFVGTKTVKIESLRLPGDWKRILASDDAKAIGESLAHVPILQRPGVRKKDRAVIFGRHRLAALQLGGQRSAEVDLWDCTDEEIDLAKDVENAFRRGPDTDARQRLIARWTQEIAAAREVSRDTVPESIRDTVPEKPAKVGRPKAPKTEARERVAAIAGVKPETLRKQEQRAKAKEDDGRTRDESSYLWRLGAFECWGLDHLVTEQFARQVVLTREAVTDVTGKFNAVLSSITKAIEADKAVAADLDLQGVYSRTQQLASALREIYPVALCPSCKCVPELLRRCGACRGRGTVGKEKLEQSPRELRTGGEAAGVYVQGQFVRLSEMSA